MKIIIISNDLNLSRGLWYKGIGYTYNMLRAETHSFICGLSNSSEYWESESFRGFEMWSFVVFFLISLEK